LAPVPASGWDLAQGLARALVPGWVSASVQVSVLASMARAWTVPASASSLGQ